MKPLTVCLLASNLLACDQTSQPTESPAAGTVATRAYAAGSLAKGDSALHFQLRELAADAFFATTDGCIATDALVVGSQQAVKVGPGKPTRVPVALVFVSVFDLCAGQLLRDIFGETSNVEFTADRVKLSQARLQATVPATDFVTGAELDVEVDVAWTSFGEPSFQSSRNMIRQGGLLIRELFKGPFRDATATGSVIVGGENIASEPALFGDVFRIKTGDFLLVRTR